MKLVLEPTWVYGPIVNVPVTSWPVPILRGEDDDDD